MMADEYGRIGRSPSSRTNTNDRLPRGPLGRVEGGDGIVEGRDGPDVRPQSSVPDPLDDLTQLGTIGLDNEVDRKAINRSEEHTSELQSPYDLVCRLLLEKKKKKKTKKKIE